MTVTGRIGVVMVAALLIVVLASLAAVVCAGPSGHTTEEPIIEGPITELGITIDNQTGAVLCSYEGNASGGFGPSPGPSPTEADAFIARTCVDEIEPYDDVDWRVLCESNDVLTIVLADRTGPVIYRGTTTCGRWDDSGAWIKVTQEDGRFITSDSLTKNP